MRSTLQCVSHFFSLRKRKDWAFPEELCRRFSLAEIRAATQCFSASLRTAPLRSPDVYKGHIAVNRDGNSSTEVVAIKRIFREQRVHQFKKEVQLLCQLRHPNLISLIGFCQENGKCFIVYEYMPNGSLSDHLFDTSNIKNKDAFPLTWKQRLKICLGVARAIHYLHAGVKHAIIHRMVQCSNILLDQNLVPKLSGLGVAKMGPLALSNALIRLNPGVVICQGHYHDPEYYLSGQLTDKSDVFSFGIVLFEVLCAKSFSRYSTISSLRHRIGCVEGGENFQDMIDPFLKGKVATDCLRKFMNVAERCVRPTGAERPTKGEVEVELECADAVKQLKELGTTTSTSLAPPAHDMGDYTYQDISFSEITQTFLNLFEYWMYEC